MVLKQLETSSSILNAPGDPYGVVSPFAATAVLVVLLPWSSSVKRGRTPAGTPLISEWFGEVSSAPADAVSSATPTSPLPPCRLIDETDELPATETPATPIQDVTVGGFRKSLHF